MSSENGFPLTNLSLSDLDLTRDCASTGSALALLLESGILPFESMISMVRANYDGNLTATDADLVGWYTSTNDSLADGKDQLIDSCFAEFCRALQWEGNSDLAGIGVRPSGC